MIQEIIWTAPTKGASLKSSPGPVQKVKLYDSLSMSRDIHLWKPLNQLKVIEKNCMNMK